MADGEQGNNRTGETTDDRRRPGWRAWLSVTAGLALILWTALLMIDRLAVVNRLTRPLDGAGLNAPPAGAPTGTPGVALFGTLINLVRTEFDRPFGGYRPDNLVWFGGLMPFDNVESFQHGVIETVQRTVVRLGLETSGQAGAQASQPDVVARAAESLLFRRDAPAPTRWQLSDGVGLLERHCAALSSGTANHPVGRRQLHRLLATFRDLLDDHYRRLTARPIPAFAADDSWYRARGGLYALLALLRAVRIEYGPVLTRSGAGPLLDRTEATLAEALSSLPPPVVFDGRPNAFLLANHRANLAVCVQAASGLLGRVVERL